MTSLRMIFLTIPCLKFTVIKARLLLVVLLGMSLMGCIVKPNIESRYDQACNIQKHHITLSVKQVATFGARNCRNQHACKAQLVTQFVGASIIFPVSAVISGSIALVGNTLFWLQERKC